MQGGKRHKGHSSAKRSRSYECAGAEARGGPKKPGAWVALRAVRGDLTQNPAGRARGPSRRKEVDGRGAEAPGPAAREGRGHGAK